MAEEVELSRRSRDGYEVIPITPIRRIERRMNELEKAGTIPQLQTLISQIVELIKGNQQLIDSVIHADAELRNELSKLPPKIDDVVRELRNFIGLVEAAGRDEISSPGPETMKPLVDKLQELLDQNKKMTDNNKAVLEALDNINRKLKSGTPVSKILSSYPGMRLKRG